MRLFLAIAAGLGFLGVALGAFGAHFLKSRLAPNDLETFEVAVRYQMYHALALAAVAILWNFIPGRLLNYSGVAFVVGTVIFSGSLYLLVGTGIRTLGAVTPIGGLFLLAGWALLALSAIL